MYPPLILGTAQLGFPYGIANTIGKPDQQMANTLVAAAWNRGVHTFDTAQAYGDSESVLGQALSACGAAGRARVISKLSPTLPASATHIEETLQRSRKYLRASALYCVMLHREEQLSLLDGYAGEALCRQRSTGLLEHIGISVYTPNKALEALLHPLVDVIQVPASLFDRRCEAEGVFALARKTNKEVHIRSAFLQGVLLMPPQRLPNSLKELAPALESFSHICKENNIPPSLAALIWLHNHYPEALIVFGAETVQQVQENLDLHIWQQGLSSNVITQLDAILPPQRAELLNPSLWKR